MLVRIFFCGLLAVFHVNACGVQCAGATCQIISNPTFSFDFNPPVPWTYYDLVTTPAGFGATPNIYPGQWSTLSDAQRQVQSDINVAILNSLQKLGISSVGVTWVVTGYTPDDILIEPDGNNAQGQAVGITGTYKVEIGAVTEKRTCATGITGCTYTDYIKTLSIQVNGSPPATIANWKYLGNAVYNYLTLNAKVIFKSQIRINGVIY